MRRREFIAGLGGLSCREKAEESWRGMKLPIEDNFCNLAAGAAALPVVSQIATAQTYIRIV